MDLYTIHKLDILWQVYSRNDTGTPQATFKDFCVLMRTAEAFLLLVLELSISVSLG
jgi:hypothetical protein